MNRKIKFRAWDKEMKQFIVIGFSVFGETTLFHLIEMHCRENNLGKSTLDRLLHDIEITQFTGLHDKDGKEIYEGDILNGRNRVLKIVYWCNKRAAFCESEQFMPKPAKHSFAKLYDKFGKVFNDGGLLKNHFVIGNIYENPELLTSKTNQHAQS